MPDFKLGGGKDHLRIFKRFKFERIAGRVLEKQRRLFANLPRESDLRFDQKSNASFYKTVAKAMPLIPGQNDSEVGGRDLLPIDWVGRGTVWIRLDEMGSDLMSIEIEVDPSAVFTSSGAS